MRLEEKFKNFVASKVVDNDKILVFDWRNQNGSGEYSIRYYLDIKRGTLMISGDLGSCVACWHNEVTPSNLKSYVSSIGYFIEKIQCATNIYTFNSSDIEEDLNKLQDNLLVRYKEITEEEIIADIAEIREILADFTLSDDCQFPQALVDIFEKYDSDWFENHEFVNIGRRVDPRVLLWAKGLQMAISQMEKENPEGIVIEASYTSEERCIMDGYTKVRDGLYVKNGSYAEIVGY